MHGIKNTMHFNRIFASKKYMKQAIKLLLAILVVITLLQSCKKDSGGTTTYASTQGRVTATGGLTFDISGTNTVFSRKTTATIDSIYIGAAITITPSITGAGFILKNISTPGTYSLAASSTSQNAAAGYYAGSNSADSYSSTFTATNPGTITVSTISATAIEGTYTTTVTNYLGTAITFSGTFKGSF